MAPRASWGSWGALGELWGVSGGPRVGFGTFWGDLGGSLGGVRRPIINFRKHIRYKFSGFAAWAIFSDVKGCLDFVCFFIVFRSVVFVNRGGEFLVKHVKIEGFEFGPVRIFQENHDEKVGFGR